MEIVLQGIPMPEAARAPAKSTRQTWRDWAPDAPEPDELLSRDELVERLASQGVKVSVRDLRNWQVGGVIPYGIRKWDGDAPRSMYPPWMIDLVRDLRAMQAQGVPLAEIGHKLQTRAPALAARRDAVIQAGTATATAQGGRLSGGASSDGSVVKIEAHDTLRAELTETVSIVKTVAQDVAITAAPDDIASRLLEWARNHERAFGIKIDHVAVSLVDDRGRPLTFRFDTATN